MQQEGQTLSLLLNAFKLRQKPLQQRARIETGRPCHQWWRRGVWRFTWALKSRDFRRIARIDSRIRLFPTEAQVLAKNTLVSLVQVLQLNLWAQGSKISLTHSPFQRWSTAHVLNSHFGWSLATKSTNVVWMVRQGTVSLAMRPSKGMKCHTRISSTTVQQCS